MPTIYSLPPEEYLEEAKRVFREFQKTSLPPVFLGYNMNIDWIVHTKSIDLIKTLSRGIKEQVFPQTIIKEFIESFRIGAAKEIVIPKKMSHGQISLYFPTGTPRIGGQVGLMAEYISKLFNKWRAYAFLPGTKHDWEKYGIKLPEINWIEDDLFFSNDNVNVHVILEYERGQEVADLNGKIISAPRENRFIIAFEPPISQKTILAQRFKETLETNDDIKAGVVAGIHLPWFIEEANTLTKVIKDYSQKKVFHLEWTHLPKKEETICGLLKQIHSLGFNEQEVLQVQRCSEQTNPEFSISNFAVLIKQIKDHYLIPRIHGHTYGKYVIIDEFLPEKRISQALLSSYNALLVCGTENYNMKQLTVEDIEGKFTAITKNHEITEFEIPVFKKPLRTVGLGDVISLSGFASYLSQKINSETNN